MLRYQPHFLQLLRFPLILLLPQQSLLFLLPIVLLAHQCYLVGLTKTKVGFDKLECSNQFLIDRSRCSWQFHLARFRESRS